jgi:glycosyltransferase involved in cell wall biosynthesis
LRETAGARDLIEGNNQRQRIRVQRLLQRNRELAERLRASEQRANTAELRLKEIKTSFTWRSTRFVRKIEAKWHRLMGIPVKNRSEDIDRTSPLCQFNEGNSSRIALIIDYRWPRCDQDSGSIDAVNLVDALVSCEFHVCFYADTEYNQNSNYRSDLETRGVLCLGAPYALDLEHFLDKYGEQIQLCILTRVYAGGNYLDLIHKHCTQAYIVFNPVDLHFVREERKAVLAGDASASAAAAATRARELLVFREADATIVVSTAEQELLERLDPRANVVHLPLARPVVPPRTAFEERRGIGFVGGFEHAPNLDAVQFFLAEVWPLVRNALPGCEFSIVGNGLDGDLVGDLGPGIRYLGHLPDLAAWLETLRLTVAPLRFGAGAKGKIASSLACGVPCVGTAMAVEGMGLDRSQGVLVADTPATFAECVRLAHTDATLWRQLSEAGLAYAREALSTANYRRGVAAMLEGMGLASTGT